VGNPSEETQLFAIKILPALAGRDLEFEARFLRESKALNRLKHPNLVHIEASGQTDDGDSYLVMEYLEGGDLRQRLETGAVDVATALEIALQVCEGLQSAHEAGYVHRDIKPANILLTREGIAKLADFGLAKLIDPATASETEQLGLTQTGLALGTPNYMAPEQVAGLPVDHRADLYSLGVTLYEMLTGSLPHGTFEPPSSKVRIDRRLDAVVFKAMSQAVARRYASAHELAQDLRLIAQGRPGRTLAEREQSPTQSLGWWPWLIVPGAIALLANFGVSTWRLNPPLPGSERPPSLTTRDQPFENHLGMRFVPVPIIGGPTNGKRVLFSVWETRIRDYRPFAEATQREWPKAGPSVNDDHPATMVTWKDAAAFCEWLSSKERRAGQIGPKDTYRLPTDHEWSCAAGIGAEENPEIPPMSKSGKVEGYPWGLDFPPSFPVGNYLGQERFPNIKSPDLPIPGYSDGFAETAPVGQFPANPQGLFDLGGNVFEMCADWADPVERSRKVLRGASWNNASRESLSVSRRNALTSSQRSEISVQRFGTVGFRVVLQPARISQGSRREAPPNGIACKAREGFQGERYADIP